MGQYEPEDSRKVTLSNDTAPGEPDRTGPRESETRRGEQSRAQNNQKSSHTDPLPGAGQAQSEGPLKNQGQAQAGYGNSRDGDGNMEQDANRETRTDKSGDGDRFVGETSPDPARRAQADAKRPLGSD